MPDEPERDEYEQIPWSSLVPPSTDGTSRWLMLAAVAVVGLVAGLAGARFISPRPVQTLEQVAATQASPGANEVPPTTGVISDTPPAPTFAPPPAPPTPPAPPAVYSEADLMAVLPDEQIRLAVMRAEWFVTDYFTVGAWPGNADAVRAHLSGELATSELPHERASTVEYVEWARAFNVAGTAPDRYDVSVAYRLLVQDEPGSGFRREPVRAVTVRFEVDAQGAFVVGGLPEPVTVPGPQTAATEPLESLPTPERAGSP